MLLKIFIMPVYLAGVLVFFLYPQGLHGRNDDTGCSEYVGRANIVDIFHIKNGDPLQAECGIQCFPAGMRRVPQRLYCLFPYGVGGHEPENKRMLPVKTGFRGDSHAVRGKQRFSPACGEAQADIGHIVHAPAGMIGRRPHIGRMFRRHFSERRLWSPQGRLFQILPEYAQRFLLIFLQLKHGGAPNGP